METVQPDLNRSLMLDGNAAAGILDEIFALEMTSSPIQCRIVAVKAKWVVCSLLTSLRAWCCAARLARIF